MMQARWRAGGHGLVVWAAASLVLMAAGACSRPASPAGPAGPDQLAQAAPAPDARFVERLALKLTYDASALPPGPPGTELARLRGLLDTRAFAYDVALRILSRELSQNDATDGETIATLLRSEGAPPLYYVRRPCDRAQAVAVTPWWAPATTVLVCPEAYQPGNLWDPKTGWYCSGYFAQRGAELSAASLPQCGCGPNLVNCLPDNDVYDAFAYGMKQEVIDTVGDIVFRDAPLTDVFTTNQTVQNRYSRFAYARWRVMGGLQPSAVLDDLPAARAPRSEPYPGAHAGILTMPYLQYEQDSMRARALRRHSLLWCISSGSGHVLSEDVMKVGATNLRELEGWKKLAASPGCTACHAHLDYGTQFFQTYSSAWVGVANSTPPLRHAETGPMYGVDMEDLRGHAPLSPAGFARLAIDDKAFARCMTRRVTDYLVPEGLPAAEMDRLAARFRARPSLKDLVASTLEAALAWHAHNTSSRAAAPRPVGTMDDLRQRCADCHDEGPLRFFDGERLVPAALPAMIDAVAESRMPPGDDLERREQVQLISTMIDLAWTAPADRQRARDFYLGAGYYLVDAFASRNVIDQSARCRGAGANDGGNDRAHTARPVPLTSGTLTDLDALKLAMMMASSETGAKCGLARRDWHLLLEPQPRK